MMGEDADDVSLSLQEEVAREQLQIMDTLHGEIKRRTSHMIDVNAKFGFLTKMELLMDSNKDKDIDSAIELLTAIYFDISAENLKNEVRRVRRHIRSFEMQTGEMVGHWNSLDLLQWLV
ncbi:Zinc finger MYM-type protein 1 [Oopsacas minuta]|uniref:Zinc finger MYM-type protein 1 n=1 Tax=Oopsacas minuta TaxID=111878 RepID=A0AAV7JII8_9METZ|nr:Zinc finger MYM-type protein 1 [Oopsacas minuta]